MSRLLDSITLYSEAGHVKQTAEKVNLNMLLAEVIAKMALEFEPDIRAKKVKIFSDSGNAGAIYPCKDEG
jgi:hypothetical protein